VNNAPFCVDMNVIKTAEARRLVMFAVVGTVNTAVCYALYVVLVAVLEWNYDVALFADYVFGIALGYALHRLSTFADRTSLRQAFGKYTLTMIVTFLANLLLLDWLVRAEWMEPLPAQAIAMCAVMLASYVVQTHWVFRSHGDQAAECPARAS
jgi:putative flippase GtrA